MKSKLKYALYILLPLILCILFFVLGNLQIKKQQTENISSAALASVQAFNELLSATEEDNGSHELVYRDAVSKYYAMIHTAINIKDTPKHEYPCKDEMYALYGELLAADHVSSETVDLIVSACTAVAQGESESAIEDWLIQAHNSLQHGE